MAAVLISERGAPIYDKSLVEILAAQMQGLRQPWLNGGQLLVDESLPPLPIELQQ